VNRDLDVPPANLRRKTEEITRESDAENTVTMRLRRFVHFD
jgi:hypothetical protein